MTHSRLSRPSSRSSLSRRAARPALAAALGAVLIAALASCATGQRSGSAAAAGRLGVAAAHVVAPATAATPRAHVAAAVSSARPPWRGYFRTRPAGVWRALPSGATCRARVHRSRWEPRPDNYRPNHTKPNLAKVRQAFRVRPMSAGGAARRIWDTWLLPRVGGQFTGTTDEIFQWAACKWGLSDNLLRAIADEESTWYQYETYRNGRPLYEFGIGDMMPRNEPGASTYCAMLARNGHDYTRDFGRRICPQTFSIAGVMSWQSPSWGRMRDNQNGTFPFNRNSTAFAVDYLAANLRGCFNGWESYLSETGHYHAGNMSGCVGAWYAGSWYHDGAVAYIHRVGSDLHHRTWLASDWSTNKPGCSIRFGCPVGGR